MVYNYMLEQVIMCLSDQESFDVACADIVPDSHVSNLGHISNMICHTSEIKAMKLDIL